MHHGPAETRGPSVRHLTLDIGIVVFVLLLSAFYVPVAAQSPSPAQGPTPDLRRPIRLTPSSPPGAFGWSVAVSGKLTIVGDPGTEVGGKLGVGRAYVFNPTTGALVSTLMSPSSQYDGSFGWSVAVGSNLAVVGEPAPVSGQNGSAYVFDPTTGALIWTLVSPNPEDTGRFGWSVAVSSKFVVVGAPFETVGGLAWAGRAYLFDATTGDFVRTLVSPDPQSHLSFGRSVAVNGRSVVVGAEGEAYVFSPGTGVLMSTLASPNPQIGGYFIVAASNKYIVVGADHETAGSYSEAGHAYVFNATTFALVQTLTSPNAQDGGYFGHSVAVSGKLVVVGASDESSGSRGYTGKAYVFDAATGAFINTLTSPSPRRFGYFGNSVAVGGNLALVGGPGERNGGHAYVYRGVS